jgi:glucosylceramidase
MFNGHVLIKAKILFQFDPTEFVSEHTNQTVEAELFVSTKDFTCMLSEKKENLIFNITESKVEQSRRKKPDIFINADSKRKYQSILGLGYSFEHTSCANFLKLSSERRREALELLVAPQKGGMNIFRICIGTPDFTGTSWYSYLDQAPEPDADLFEHLNRYFSIDKDRELIIPIVKEAMQLNRDLIIYASPWSPPAWMKDSKSMCGGKLLKQYYEIYAHYLVKFIQEYEKEGIPIYAITIQNEPMHNWDKMPTCVWKAEDERDFIRSYLGPLFQQKALKTKIWCYDHNFSFLYRPAKYPQIILQDKEAAKYIEGIAFHHYDVGGWGNPKHMKYIHSKFPDKHCYFTEGSLFWLWGALRLTRYLKNDARIYSGWVPFLDSLGQPNNGPFRAKTSIIQRDVNTNEIIINFDYYWLVQFTRFIKRGAIRIGTNEPKARGFEHILFDNPDTSKTLILTNKSKKKRLVEITDGSIRFQVILEPNSVTSINYRLI